jgi:GT2 family glycosyltransferase
MDEDAFRPRSGIVAVVLNYRHPQETLYCVRTLQKQDYSQLHVLVVDNASPDCSYEALSKALRGVPGASVIQCKFNGGYATGNNFGIRHAMDTLHPKYILIANPDVEFPEPDTVSKLVAFAEHTPDAAVVGPRVELPDGFIQGPYARPRLWLIALQYIFLPLWMFLRWRDQRATQRLKKPVRVFRTVGACMLLDAEAFCNAGMFDEATFLEGEEDILAERLRAISKHFYYLPTTKVIHHHTRRQYRNTRAAQRYYFGKYREKSPLAISVLMFCSIYYEHIVYPLVNMVRQWRTRRRRYSAPEQANESERFCDKGQT